MSIWHSLANHLWQSTLVSGLAGLLALAFRAHHARARHALWLAASVKFLIPFSVLVGVGADFGWRNRPAAAASQLAVVMEQVSQPFAPASVGRTVPIPGAAPLRLLPILATVVWLCGFAGLLFHWGIRWLRLRRVVRDASPLDLQISREIANQLQVRSSATLFEPGIFGILRPFLLLPDGIVDRLTPAQLQTIVAHELCHLRHRDNLTAALHMLVEALFWFHPMVWWIGARLVAERERGCDEEVLQMGNQPRIYAEGILKVCEFYLQSPLVCMAGVTGSNLKNRIEGIMKHQRAQKLDFARKLLLGSLGVAAIGGPLAIGLLNAPAGQAQTPEAGKTQPVFEVASIKPSKPGQSGEHRVRIQISPGGRFTAEGVNTKMLIEQAYGIRDFQLADAPNWVGSERYDIVAKGEGDKIDQDQLKLMMQALLADRFKLTIHRETKELPVYALVVGKNGPKLKPSAAEGEKGMVRIGRGQLRGDGMGMAMLANNMARQVGRTVIDKTGLTGTYDIKLEWAPDIAAPMGSKEGGPEGAAADPGGPSIFTALQEQLGLKLESQKGPVEIIHIDRIEKPSEN